MRTIDDLDGGTIDVPDLVVIPADGNEDDADQRGPLESDMRTLTERAKRQQEN